MDENEVTAQLKIRRQSYGLVNEAVKRFEVENDLHSLDDEMLERFLAETADIELDEVGKLIFLTSPCGSSWEQTSKIYRYIVSVLQENCPAYALWIAAGIAMMSNKDVNLDHRQQIAADVENLIKEAIKINDSWEAGFWGEFYIKHPMRDDKDPKWLQQAEKWLEISLEQLKVTGEWGPHELIVLADVYCGLGKLHDAARLYREALTVNSKGCCEDTHSENIKAKLALCGDV